MSFWQSNCADLYSRSTHNNGIPAARKTAINFRPCQKQGQEVVASWLYGITAFLTRALVSVKKNVMISGLLMQGEVVMGNEENCGSLVGPCEGEKHQ